MPERTLQNPMLFLNFLKRLHRTEATNELQRHGHIKRLTTSKNKPMKEYRSALYDQGIRHPSVQSFIMLHENTRQGDVDTLAYILSNRPHRNLQLDIKRKAKIAKSVRQYNSAPNRYDLPGLDSFGSCCHSPPEAIPGILR